MIVTRTYDYQAIQKAPRYQLTDVEFNVPRPDQPRKESGEVTLSLNYSPLTHC